MIGQYLVQLGEELNDPGQCQHQPALVSGPGHQHCHVQCWPHIVPDRHKAGHQVAAQLLAVVGVALQEPEELTNQKTSIGILTNQK